MPDLLLQLEATIHERRAHRPAGSYTTELLDDLERLQRKIMEEAFELCLELGRPTTRPERVAAEAADVLYHVLVGLAAVDVDVSAVAAVLEERRR